MKITKTQKKEQSDVLAKELGAKDSFIATFSGMKFKDSNVLRDNLRPIKSRFRIVRNTIVTHALETASLKSGDATLGQGPTALVTLDDSNEITRVAKELMAFSKTNPGVKWKGGFASKKWLSPADIEKLSKIGSKTELLSQLAGMLYTNIAQIRYVLEALKEQKGRLIGIAPDTALP